MREHYKGSGDINGVQGCCGARVGASDVLADPDLTRAVRQQNSVLATILEPGAHQCADLPLGEWRAKMAYEQGEFSFEVLQEILDNVDFKARRNDRGELFQQDTTDGHDIDYFTFGMYTHGGVQGVTKATVERAAPVSVLERVREEASRARGYVDLLHPGEERRGETPTTTTTTCAALRITPAVLDRVVEGDYGSKTKMYKKPTPGRPTSCGNEALVAPGCLASCMIRPRSSSPSIPTTSTPQSPGRGRAGV